MTAQRPVHPAKKTPAARTPRESAAIPETVPAASETAADSTAPIAADVPPTSTRLWHDLFFKEFFGFLACAESLMREVLPAPFIPAIDWPRMTLEPTVIIDEISKEKRVDLLFNAPLKYAVNKVKDECCCLLHLEGQSTFDKDMGYRMYSYQGALWGKRRREGRRKFLPVIFPVVVYNGKRPWRGERNFGHLVGGNLSPELRKVADPYIPKFDFIVLDVVRMEEEKLAGKGRHNIGLDLLRIARTGDIAGFFQRHSKDIMKMKAEGGQQENILKTVMKYFAMIEPEGGEKGVANLRRVLSVLPEEENKHAMTLLEILHKEGREEGIGIGVEKGREEGIGIGVEKGREEGIGIGVEKGELIGEIRAFQQVAGWRVASKQELNGKPVADLKKLLAQVRKECLAVAR